MKSFVPAIAAAMFCCMSCIDANTQLGGSLIPIDQTYSIYPTQEAIPAEALSMRMADSLSGYSQKRITIGAIRDEEYGLTTRSSVLTMVAPYDTIDFGNVDAAIIRGFHVTMAYDSISVAQAGQEKIIQSLCGHALSKKLDPSKDYDINNCGGNIAVDKSKSILKGNPVMDGSDSLSFDFTEEYARKFLSITQEDLDSYDSFTDHFPGFCLSTVEPIGNGGRINMFELQLGYSSSSYAITHNYAELKLTLDYDKDGTAEKDTSFYFMLGLGQRVDLDSLLTNVSRGNYPQYALNITTHETRSKAGRPEEKILIEGGGGLKPVISALEIKHLAEKMIIEKGGEPGHVVINKASIVFPFEFPEDYRDMDRYPQLLSPTCRLAQDENILAFASLTDSSSEDENQGDVNRSTLRYEPDITYHLQELLKINEKPVAGESDTDKTKRQRLLNGEYDIWLIIMANEEETTSSSSSSSDMSEYYQYLAYQNYYNSMYGGYGSYGYSGYGSYGSSYTNYYNYMMMAMYASSSSSSTSVTTVLDKDRYYRASLNGPAFADKSLRPSFKLTFSVANQAQ